MTEVIELAKTRPFPPAPLTEAACRATFVVDEALVTWIVDTFISGTGPLINPDHSHLEYASIGAVWASESATGRQHRMIAATAEMPQPRGRAWVKTRQEVQLQEWFGSIPDYLLTFYAPYAKGSDDTTFCALVEHELYHCAQAIDEFGNPRFLRSTGRPVFAIREHDVEEFVGVVRRYGARAAGADELVRAANSPPEIAVADLSRVCGTCAPRVA